MKQDNIYHLNLLFLIWAILLGAVFSFYIKLFEGVWPSIDYFKYIYWFFNNRYFTFLGFHINFPFRFILSGILTVITAIVISLLFNKCLGVSRIRKNKDMSYFAKWREIKKFGNDITSVSVTDKHGVVLGAYNIGIIPHSFFTKLYSSKNKFLNLIGKFFLSWSKIPVLNIFIKYRILYSSSGLALLCYAPAGTGKTAGVVLPIIWASDKDNLVINDPKGEIYSKTKDYREALGSKIIKFEWGSEVSHKWNPLDISNFINLKGTDAYYVKIAEYCTRLGDILIPSSNGSSDPFWNDSARGLFTITAMYLVYYKAEQVKSTNILEIKEYCENLSVAITPEEKEAEESGLPAIQYKIDNMIAFLEDVVLADTNSKVGQLSINQIINALLAQSKKEEKQRQTFLQTIAANTKIFSINPRVALNTSSNDITFDEVRNGINGVPITIYFIVPVSLQESYGVLSALFIEFMYQTFAALPEPTTETPLLRAILDEVGYFTPITAIKDGAAITRSYKIAWNFICQDAAQLQAKWGKEAFEIMKTNAAFQLFLCQNNSRIEKDISEALGYTEIIQTKTIAGKKEKLIEKKPLIAPNKIGTLEGKQIIKAQGKSNRPIVCDQPFYFRYPEFINKIKALKNKA